MAIEDANEKDKLLIKAEEAMKTNAGIISTAKKIVKALPPTVLAKMHCKHLEELKAAMKEYTANWRASPSMAHFQMTPSLCPWQSSRTC